ncbi:MAG: DNA-3-methyladenine glycosylase 2 family protein [Alphaproteobacteria bacterium]|nr:DNA-3-methyladenine glycosylase 2 family protein [Alphaproteobacteria bacterium]
MARPLTRRQLNAAAAHLAARDPVFAQFVAYVGECAFAPRDDHFMALVDIIAAQQVSKYAAESIRGKLRLRFGDPVDPAKIAAARLDRLRACGLSRAKTLCVRELARGVVGGTLDFAALHALDDAAATERLVALKGIGRWTAEIYLMFVLGRPDIFPMGDGALRTVIREVYALDADTPDEAILAITEGWAPYRSIASWYLYAWINRRRAEARLARQKPAPDAGEPLV